MAIKRSNQFILTTTVLLMLFLTACASQQAATSEALDQIQSDNSDSIYPITIGVLSPLTGPLSACGNGDEIGLRFALDEINKDEEKIKLVIEDTQSNPTTALTIFQRFIQKDGINIVLGACSSSSTMAIGPVAESEKKLVVTGHSIADDISNFGDYVFRIGSRASDENPFVVDFVLNELNAKRPAIIYFNNDAGLSYKDGIEALLIERGVPPVGIEAAAPTQSDFRTTLTKFKDAEADVIILGEIPQHSALVSKQMKELGMDIPRMGVSINEDSLFLQGAGEDANGFYVTSMMHVDESDPRAIAFKEKMATEFPDEIMKRDNLQPYVALKLVAEMIDICDGEHLDCIIAELYKVQDKDTILGPMSLDENGDMQTNGFIIKQVQDGKFVEI